ncbi:uncharacterized protein L3040_004743 [Drepanopeziza brunnea f. sp. 'multigermtubi']|uniref:uncharacterized protein n=2 Tax=Drepanopeziza brunnea f. sp. 'multigermtubi' TaxID=698441 RepID=UPI00239407CA|nr:hypothetical protein L3040_004743 [Drepanopeziza brunnea f. sp. 'multigermtubi']
MAGSAPKWTEEQIAFIMAQSIAGTKNSEIENKVKERWAERAVGKGAIAGLIRRQNKPKANTGRSRESSVAASLRSEARESTKATKPQPQDISPSLPEAPQVQDPASASTSPATARFSKSNSGTSPEVLKAHDTPETPDASPQLPPKSHPRSPPIPGLDNRQIEVNSSPVSSLPSSPVVQRTTSPAPEAERYGAENRASSTSPSLPPLSFTIPSISVTGAATRELIDEEAEADIKELSLAAPPHEVPESAQPPYDSLVPGSVNPSLSREVDSQATVPNSPVSANEPKKEAISSAETAAPTIVEETSPAPLPAALEETDREIADSFIEDSSVNIQAELPEPEQPAEEERASKRVKTSHEPNEFEIDIEAEIEQPESTDKMEVETKMTQASDLSPQATASTTVPDLRTTTKNNQTTRSPFPFSPPKMIVPQATPIMPVVGGTLFDSLGSEIVHFIVGPKRKDCPIHTNLLTQASPSFSQLLELQTPVPGRAEYALPDSDSDAVAFVFNYLYRQAVDLFPGINSPGTLGQRGSDDDDDHHHGYDGYANFTTAVARAIEVYILADTLRMVHLADTVITALGEAYRQGKTYPAAADIALVYARSPAGSRLRKFMARCYQVLADFEDADIETAGWSPTEVHRLISEVPELFVDWRALNRKSKALESTELSADLVCAYHLHGPDAECEFKGLVFNAVHFDHESTLARNGMESSPRLQGTSQKTPIIRPAHQTALIKIEPCG